MKLKCKGFRRYGGVFSLGPVKWEQCKATPTVMIKVKNVKETQPACNHCWQELIDSDEQEIESVEPIVEE
jgi:hypothetical protein